MKSVACIYLNRIDTGVTSSKEQRKRWKYFNGDTTCEPGQAPETAKHMLQCPLIVHPCTMDSLLKFNDLPEDVWKNERMRFADTKEEEDWTLNIIDYNKYYYY